MDISNLNLENVKKHVPSERWESSNKYFYQKDNLIHIGGETLLNYILKKINIFDPIYAITGYGKPYLKNYPKIYFNISHSAKMCFVEYRIIL